MSIRTITSLTKQTALRRQLDNCHLIAGLYCNGLSTKQLKSLRASLPPSSKLIVAKNSLMEQTLKGTKWESLKFCATGMNAWLFVHDDDGVPAALKPFREFQKKEGVGFNDFRGAVFEGRVYGPDEFGELEAMPTRMDSYRYLLGCLQTPAAWLVGILGEVDREVAAASAGDSAAVAEPAAAAQ